MTFPIINYKNSVRLGDPEVWTDGGYYFSTLNNLTHDSLSKP